MEKKTERRADVDGLHVSHGAPVNDQSLGIYLEPSGAFLSTRPEWTVNGALIQTPDGRAARLTQTPFTWIEGSWEALVTILPVEPSGPAQTMEVRVRVTPDTLRRWGDVGINPFLEACAQLQEFWRTAKPGEFARVTWL